ncbi:MAG: hypothetical protein PSV26_06500 [Polaromonas sp.]|uniref:hypothetical protein n=1 Tax=Polaromonas sp. TaxID=1869339 RepID=UPI00248987D5|nr:hypothetical protein [Polaromonas sp.]MDI1237120.1 hypothetical protein [Polaromonas sp.]
MSWLLFYILAALHPVAFIIIGFRGKTWRQRFVLWALLPIPAILYCWPYYQIKNEHAQMCAAEGGLKVLIQPEKVDRVRFVGVEFRNLGAAKGTLNRHYPQIRFAESLEGEYDGTDGAGRPYVAYTLVPNPKAGLPMAKDPWKEPKLMFTASPIDAPNSNIYEISQRETTVPSRTVKETVLSRQGTVYARYTEIVHWWAGIQYPDALPTWRCPEQKLSPPKDSPNAPKDQWHYPRPADEQLVELILK